MKESPQDLVYVKNIDVGCQDVELDQYKRHTPYISDTGERKSHETDAQREYSHARYFQVRWDGNPQRVKPGDTVIMTRFIAEHFAKYLVEHLIDKQERQTGKNLSTDKLLRKKLRDQIIVKTHSYHLIEDPVDEVEDEAVGAYESVEVPLQEEEDEITVSEPAPEIPMIETAPKKINDLRKEARELGIEWSRTDTKEDLLAKIQAF